MHPFCFAAPTIPGRSLASSPSPPAPHSQLPPPPPPPPTPKPHTPTNPPPLSVDLSRVAVSGGSHGGFLAGHLLGRHGNRFKCGVMRNPVCNVALMSGISDIPDWCFVEVFGTEEGRRRFRVDPTGEGRERGGAWGCDDGVLDKGVMYHCVSGTVHLTLPMQRYFLYHFVYGAVHLTLLMQQHPHPPQCLTWSACMPRPPSPTWPTCVPPC